MVVVVVVSGRERERERDEAGGMRRREKEEAEENNQHFSQFTTPTNKPGEFQLIMFLILIRLLLFYHRSQRPITGRSVAHRL